MTFIEFDLQKDPEASAKFAQWREQQRARLQAEKLACDRYGLAAARHVRDALVLDELAAGRFMLHLNSCNARPGTASGRKVVHAQWPDQWEFLSVAATGAEVVDCSTCNPRHELRLAFATFRKQCIWLRRCFNTFKDLFHADEAKRVLQQAAPHFFGDLNEVLLEYCRLQACKVTDPAESKVNGTMVEALTSNNLDMHLRRESLLNPAIETASKELMRYRKLVKDSRHKSIAHLDKAATIANQPLGAHSEKDVEDFLEQLQVYNDEVGRVVGEGPVCFRTQAGDGDAFTLLQCLRVALHVKNTGGEDWWTFNRPVPESPPEDAGGDGHVAH